MIAPAVVAQLLCTGVSRVIFDPTVCTMRHPPTKVPRSDGGLARNDNPERDIEITTKLTLRKQQYRSDTHGLLCIIPTMAK